MRKALALPTGGMILGFGAGLALGFVFGPNFAVWASSIASEFFSSLGIILGTAFGIVLLVLIAVLLIKAWYFLVPFIIGLICGILLVVFLGSSLYEGITTESMIILSFIVTRDAPHKRPDFHGLSWGVPSYKVQDVVS